MTLREIAKALDVSPSTVSRVLNGYNENFSVTPDVRERILMFVRESGYRANPVFSTMRSKRSNMVSLILYSSFYYGSVLRSAVGTIAEALIEKNYQVNYSICPLARESGYRLPPWKSAALVIPDVLSPKQLVDIERSGVPYVSLNGVCGENGSCVNADEQWHTQVLTEKLIAAGHRRILFVQKYPRRKMPDYSHYSISERQQSFEDQMRKHQLPLFPILACSLDEHVPAVLELIEKEKITAVISYDAEMAVMLLDGMRERGIRIPQDISIATFNDFFLIRYIFPRICRIAIPAREMGLTAVNLLHETLENHTPLPKEPIRLRGSMIEGNSILPPSNQSNSRKGS